MVERALAGDYAESFRESHQREFGFWLTKRRVLVDNVRVRSVGTTRSVHALPVARAQPGEEPVPTAT